MTNFIRTIIASLLLIAGSQSVLGQTFSSMDETQRQTELTKIALTVYKNPKFSKYYYTARRALTGENFPLPKSMCLTRQEKRG